MIELTKNPEWVEYCKRFNNLYHDEKGYCYHSDKRCYQVLGEEPPKLIVNEDNKINSLPDWDEEYTWTRPEMGGGW